MARVVTRSHSLPANPRGYFRAKWIIYIALVFRAAAGRHLPIPDGRKAELAWELQRRVNGLPNTVLWWISRLLAVQTFTPHSVSAGFQILFHMQVLMKIRTIVHLIRLASAINKRPVLGSHHTFVHVTRRAASAVNANKDSLAMGLIATVRKGFLLEKNKLRVI